MDYTQRHEEALGLMIVFIILIVVMVSQVYKYVKTHQIRQFIVWQLYLNNEQSNQIMQKKP